MFVNCLLARHCLRGRLQTLIGGWKQIRSNVAVGKVGPASAVFRGCLGTGLLMSGQSYLQRSTALCKAPDSTLELQSKGEAQPKFDWWKLWELLKPNWKMLIVAVASAFLAAVLNVEIPRSLGSIINIVTRYTNPASENENYWPEVIQPGMKLAMLYLTQATLTLIYIHSISCVGERVACQVRRDLFLSIVQQDMVFFDKHRTGELVDRMTSDVQDFKSSLKMCISQGLRCTTQLLGCVVSMYSVSPTLTLYAAAIIPSVIGIGSLLGSLLRGQSRAAQAELAQCSSICEETLSNMRTVRAFAMEDTQQERFDEQAARAKVLQERLGLGIGIFQAGTNMFLNSMVLATVGFGGSLLSSGQLKAGDLMTFLVATQTIQKSLGQLSLLFGHYVRGVSAGIRIFEYSQIQPDVPLHQGLTLAMDQLRGTVHFERVQFAYPTRPGQTVLRDFSLELPAGKVVALVGSSGGGKSTVACLLERFYDINQGRITIDGIDIRTLDPCWLRGNVIGFINQEPVLFATSVMENIRFGKPSATDQEVREAAKLANADAFIRNFPDGYETVVGERGVAVSGGQKQRIAIARALLKKPAILILDEATSALDSESERIVQEALDQVAAGRTVLIVAHRLSTVRNADLIAVIANGAVAELGTHESLSQLRGLYWNLVKKQESATGEPSESETKGA